MAKTFNLARMTTATTGTGTITLGSAASGYLSFSSAGVKDGDVVSYGIVDGANSEVGYGTYTASGTTLTRNVTKSTNSDTAISLSGGAHVMVLARADDLRYSLDASTTFYVGTGGNDTTGNGTSGNPWLTIQKAVSYLAAHVDFNGFIVTVQVGNGTYSAGAVIPPMVGQVNAEDFVIAGDVSTPSNVLISTTSGAAIFQADPGARVVIKGFKFVSATATTHHLYANNGGFIETFSVDFGACTGRHMQVNSNGNIVIVGAYTISGSAVFHYSAVYGGNISTAAPYTITLTGTPAFAGGFALSYGAGSNVNTVSVTWSGSATGSRYLVTMNGVIDTAGGGANYFPGNAAGTASSGGQYA